MGSSWGVGFVRHHSRSIADHAQAIEALRRFADGVGDSVCDVVENQPLQVWYFGSSELLTGQDADELMSLIKSGDDLTYDELTLLDPYYVTMVCDKPFDLELPWGDKITVQPLRWLREHLMELLASGKLPEVTENTFRTLLDTCIKVSRLNGIVMVGD